MARGKKKTDKLDYRQLQEELKKYGPDRLYFLYGEEDYLKEAYYKQLRNLCVFSDSDFNYHRLRGEKFDIDALIEAINSVPFMGERTFIEIRNFDINSCNEEIVKKLNKLFDDIPDYATIAFLQMTGKMPDGRKAAFKLMKKKGKAVEFTTQPQDLLVRWIAHHFEAYGKHISKSTCEKLIFTSGDLMTRLLPEIEKIAGYVEGNTITSDDIDKVAMRIPESRIFDMTDCLSQKNYDGAIELLADLLELSEHPIMILAMIGFQMRRLYWTKIAVEDGGGKRFIMDKCGIKYTFVVDKLMRSARGFTVEQLKYAVEQCAISDYLMKSSGQDDEDVLKDLILRIAVGESK